MTQRVRQVLELASHSATERGDVVVDTRHALYGMVAEGGGVAAVALRDFDLDAASLGDWIPTAAPDADLSRLPVIDDDAALATIGVDMAEVRRRADEAFGRGALGEAPRPPLGDDAIAWLKAAHEAAASLGNNYVGTEHLLLAYAGEGSVGANRLRELGVSPDAVRGRVLQTVERLQQAAAQNPDYQELSRQLAALQQHVESLEVEARRKARPVLARLNMATSEEWARLYPNPAGDGETGDLRQRFVSGIAKAVAAARAELRAAGLLPHA